MSISSRWYGFVPSLAIDTVDGAAVGIEALNLIAAYGYIAQQAGDRGCMRAHLNHLAAGTGWQRSQFCDAVRDLVKLGLIAVDTSCRPAVIHTLRCGSPRTVHDRRAGRLPSHIIRNTSIMWTWGLYIWLASHPDGFRGSNAAIAADLGLHPQRVGEALKALAEIADDNGVPVLRIAGARAAQHVSTNPESLLRDHGASEQSNRGAGAAPSPTGHPEAALVIDAIRERGFRVTALVEADVEHYLAQGQTDILLDAVRRAAECRASAWGYVLAVLATFIAQPYEHDKWRRHWAEPAPAETPPTAVTPLNRRSIAAPPELQAPPTSLKDQTIMENPRERAFTDFRNDQVMLAAFGDAGIALRQDDRAALALMCNRHGHRNVHAAIESTARHSGGSFAYFEMALRTVLAKSQSPTPGSFTAGMSVARDTWKRSSVPLQSHGLYEQAINRE